MAEEVDAPAQAQSRPALPPLFCSVWSLSRDILTDTPRNNIFPALCSSVSQVTLLTYKRSHHTNQVLCLSKPLRTQQLQMHVSSVMTVDVLSAPPDGRSRRERSARGTC